MSGEGPSSFYDPGQPIKEVMARKLIGIPVDSSCREAGERMLDFRINSLVVTRDEETVGLISRADLLRAVVVADQAGGGIEVGEAMHATTLRVDVGLELSDALAQMQQAGVRRCLVEEDGDVVGLLTMRDLFDHRSMATFVSR